MQYDRPGQPTKFTPENKEKLLYAIRKGAPYELACNYAGICYVTFMNWRKKAYIEKLPDFVSFFRDLKIAEGETSLVWLDKIDSAMDTGAWQAAAWKLERRHNKYFSGQAAINELNERLERLEKGTSNGNDDQNKEVEKE